MRDRLAIAQALREMGLLLQLKGESPFRARAYEVGAQALESYGGDLGALVAAGQLTAIPGIGEALARKITELHQTGRSPSLERLRAELPPGILALSQVPDLGPKKIAALYQALGIGSLDELRAACEAGQVREVKGFGERTERKILEALDRLEARGRRALLLEALEAAQRLVAHLGGAPTVARVELAGSARRFQETVGDLDLVAAAGEPRAVVEHLLRHPLCAGLVELTGDRCRVRLASGLLVDLWVAPPATFAAALLLATGSHAHLQRLRRLAAERGLLLDERGLRGPEGPRAAGSEEAIYGALGLPFIPPELREDEGEIEAALGGDRFADLLRLEDVRGAVHCHTVYSDGKNTIEEMAQAAEALGLSYLTITDHSRSAGYAGGLKVDRLAAQWEEIARVQERTPVQLLRGTESDILGDGALDYPDEVLSSLDIIIASIHSRMKMDEEQMTRRLVRAMRQPRFKIWGHALGRLLQQREPFACRVEEVLDAIAESRAAVEVNGDPNRLDMEPRWLRQARRRNIRFVVSTDAHSVAGLGNLPFAVGTARRAGVRRGEVLNTLPAEEFRRAVRP